MTEAYAIKEPDGIIRRTIADSSRDAWMLYLGGPKEMHRQVTAELAGLRCVPVTVSEKGEVEALLREARMFTVRYRAIVTNARYAEEASKLIERIDACLSRGQG